MMRINPETGDWEDDEQDVTAGGTMGGGEVNLRDGQEPFNPTPPGTEPGMEKPHGPTSFLWNDGTYHTDPEGTNPGGGQWSIGHLLGLPNLPNIPNAPAPDLPTWQKPDAFSYQDWQAPSVADAMADPSYKFRVNQGGDALQRWAASKGTLNDTGTAKALMDYGQSAGSQEYNNIWNRDFSAYNTGRQNALQTYNTNYNTQYVDPYRANYQRGMDLWQPQMETWRANNANNTLGYTTEANWATHANDQQYADLWNRRNGFLQWGLAG